MAKARKPPPPRVLRAILCRDMEKVYEFASHGGRSSAAKRALKSCVSSPERMSDSEFAQLWKEIRHIELTEDAAKHAEENRIALDDEFRP